MLVTFPSDIEGKSKGQIATGAHLKMPVRNESELRLKSHQSDRARARVFMEKVST